MEQLYHGHLTLQCQLPLLGQKAVNLSRNPWIVRFRDDAALNPVVLGTATSENSSVLVLQVCS